MFVGIVMTAVLETSAPSVTPLWRRATFFWRKRQPFCHFVTFPLTGDFPVTSDGGGFK